MGGRPRATTAMAVLAIGLAFVELLVVVVGRRRNVDGGGCGHCEAPLMHSLSDRNRDAHAMRGGFIIRQHRKHQSRTLGLIALTHAHNTLRRE